MKIRQGFVSNSSSSCFMLGTETGHTIDSLYSELEQMYVKLNSKLFNSKLFTRKEDKILRKQFKDMLHVLEVNDENRLRMCAFINRHTCCGFASSEIKDGLWIISNGDNAIPHELLYAIKDKFGVKWQRLS